MKKPAKVKRKTGSRAKQARTPARAQPSAKSRSQPRRSRSPKVPAAASAARQRRVAVLADAYSVDERHSLLLLLAPFFLMTLAIGLSQSLKPGSLEWRLAQLPGPASLAHAVPPLALTVAAAKPHWATEPLEPLPPAKSVAHLPGPSAVADIVSASPLPTASVALGEGVASLEPLPPLTMVAVQTTSLNRLAMCEAPPAFDPPVHRTAVPVTDPAKFGLQLAAAARAQTAKFVIYTDKYRTIGFPMGDVPAMYGVCTDVVIRAYRALGIDLQVLVHNARLGTGDTSIDHRRTKTLRRFFETHGISIPVTDFHEDYRPGDIVTYHRAQGRGSQSHIAIVSDVIAPSGRPMIVHNRGWGPQLEDALFAHQLTGHYKFTGAAAAAEMDASTATPAEYRHAQTPAPGDGGAVISASSAH